MKGKKSSHALDVKHLKSERKAFIELDNISVGKEKQHSKHSKESLIWPRGMRGNENLMRISVFFFHVFSRIFSRHDKKTFFLIIIELSM